MTASDHPLSNRCATCKRWEGDRGMAFAEYSQAPDQEQWLDPERSWPSGGKCRVLDEYVLGYDYESFTEPNFGCIRHRHT